MKNLYFAQDITKMDNIAQTTYHQPGIILMEQAGLKAWLYIKEKLKKSDNIVVVCGGGNNGGDALVIARCAYNDGFENVNIVYCSSRYSESFSIQDKIIKSYNLPIFEWSKDIEKIETLINTANVIVDGIVGIGLKHTLKDNLIPLVNLINNSLATKYSIDVPSGISDVKCGISVNSDFTFCMGPLKAMYFHPSNIEKVNEVIEINPSFPPQVFQEINPVARLDDKRELSLLPLNKSAYKKTRGNLALFGGSRKYPSAIRLSSRAAFSSRCGLVTAYCDSDIYSIVATESPSVIVNEVNSKMDLTPYTALLVGPGWGSNREDLLLDVLSFNKPTLIDADGIRSYASLYKEGKIRVENNDKLLFTPHLGELRVLLDAVLGDYSLENTKDFLKALTLLSNKLNATIVCKSSVVHIVSVDHLPLVVYNLNPSLAVGGSGDVLAGCIASLLSYGLTLYESAKEGVILHINAGEKANEEIGFYTSEELITFIGKQLI